MIITTYYQHIHLHLLQSINVAAFLKITYLLLPFSHFAASIAPSPVIVIAALNFLLLMHASL